MAAKEPYECRMVVEQVCAFGVDVDEIECAWALGELRLDAANERLQYGRLKWVEKEQERRRAGEDIVERVLFGYLNRG